MYNESNKLDGIIAHLTRECGGNVHRNGIVYVIARCRCQDNVVDLKQDNCYISKGEKDISICYDFRERRVIPTSYSVKSRNDPHGSHHLKSWLTEVSNDGYSWIEIDRQENNDDLNGPLLIANFKIAHVPSESFRFFRLRQIGPNHHGGHEFSLASMELFGTLSIVEKTEQPQQQKREFVYQADKEEQSPPPLIPPEIDGIITHLTLECGGNVHDKGIVHVMGESEHPEKAVDMMIDTHYFAHDELDMFLCYDFKERRVIPTSYSLVSGLRSPGSWHLKSWVVEVSNDGYVWVEIDRRQDNNDLNAEGATANFQISSIIREGFRLFRLRPTGPSHCGKNVFSIAYMEIFGTLFVTEKTELVRRETTIEYHGGKEIPSQPPLFPRELDGIIAFLTLEFGGNVSDTGVARVFTSGDDYLPEKNVAALQTNSYCVAHPDPGCDPFIGYEFMECHVIPTSYSVKSCRDPERPMSWVIEVSNDGYSWTEIDRRENNDDLNEEHVTVNFTIQRVPTESFRFFRFRQTESHGSRGGFFRSRQNVLHLTALEVFGTIVYKETRKEKPQHQEFVYRSGRDSHPIRPPELDGIIAYLTHECNGNVHEKGIVNVTASGTDDGLVPQNVVDLKSDHSFRSRYGENQWICYDFKDRRVTPTGYTVKTSQGYDHLKSWVIEVSNDGDVWTQN